MKSPRNLAKPYYDSSSHRWKHVERVRFLAMLIGDVEGADLSILEPAAYFHDCAKYLQHNKVVEDHAEAGAEIAREVLKDDYSKEDLERIAQCIAVHRFKKGLPAQTLEEEILQDADRLDKIGYAAIARELEYCGIEKILLYHLNSSEEKPTITSSKFYRKSITLKPKTFNTEIARKLAEGRYKYTKDFIERFVRERNEK